MSDLQKAAEKQKEVVPDLYLLYDAECGLGHKRRSYAIVEYWLKHGGRVWYHHWENPKPKSVILIDGYNYEFSVYENFIRLGHFVVAIDDRYNALPCHLQINYNLGAKIRGSYVRETLYLLGPRYFPVSEIVKEAMISYDGPPFDCESVNRQLNYPAFIERMARARYVICSASVKAYEALYLGKPILLRETAPNQHGAYEALLSSDWALPDTPGSRVAFQDEGFMRIWTHGRDLVDGNGGNRIVDAILEEYANAQI